MSRFTSLNFFKNQYLKTKAIRIALAFLALSSVHGCAVISQVYPTDQPKVHPENFNLTKGLSLQIKFNNLTSLSKVDTDIKAWESINLFTTVTQTSSDLPSPYGYYLRMECKRDNWESDDELPEMMLQVMTLFIFPSTESSSQHCEYAMYENSIEIAHSSTGFKYYKYRGFGMMPWFFQRASIYDTHAETAANIRVRDVLAELTRSKP